jgi:AraC-like DNA-binding protein
MQVIDATEHRADRGSDHDSNQGLLTRIHAHGLDEAAEQLAPIMRARYVQLERGRVCMRGAIARLDRVSVARFCADRNRIVHVDTEPGRLMLFVPMRGTARLGTAEICPQHVVLVSRAAQIVAFSDRRFVPLSISANADEVRQLADDLKISIGRLDAAPAVSVLKISATQVLILDQLVQTVIEAGALQTSRPAARMAGLDAAIMNWCAVLLGTERIQPHVLEAAAARKRAALRAREFIDAHVDQPLCLARLCHASYASARALEYGFREMFGLSPMAYVRCARLAGVRHDLYCARRGEHSVTQLAMKWGFWHLGQFSKDYCTQFGELPSATLQASCGSAPASGESRDE